MYKTVERRGAVICNFGGLGLISLMVIYMLPLTIRVLFNIHCIMDWT